MCACRVCVVCGVCVCVCACVCVCVYKQESHDVCAVGDLFKIR